MIWHQNYIASYLENVRLFNIYKKIRDIKWYSCFFITKKYRIIISWIQSTRLMVYHFFIYCNYIGLIDRKPVSWCYNWSISYMDYKKMQMDMSSLLDYNSLYCLLRLSIICTLWGIRILWNCCCLSMRCDIKSLLDI